MKSAKKINRKILVLLTLLKVEQEIVANFFNVSRKTIYTYLKKYPITETELNSIKIDYQKLTEIFNEYIKENEIVMPKIDYKLNQWQSEKLTHAYKITWR
ncbi:MAG: hypothetical protein IKZ88_08505 [Neisseriaceae bacterium]|nr:hypothetical protein [Neisseriaceae bacterium]